MSPRPDRRVVVLTAVVALVVGALAAVLVLRVTDRDTVLDTGADAGFARDMQTHHHQAVEMAFLVRDRTEDSEVRTLAFDIITSQQQQAGQMYGWLVQWGLPQTGPREPMAWAGGEHGHSAGEGMPGLATPAQLDELRAAEGVEAERVFLRLMIEHHRGGLDMARAAIADARTDEVLTLARAIEVSQSAEIDLMESMLGERS